MQDELFRPTIQERAAAGPRPWRPDSIFYPAFFGGPLTATALGLLNGRRLGVARGPMLAIAAAGLLCFAARVAISAAVGGGSGLRLAGSVSGVLVALVVGAVERRSFRAFLYRGGEPARMIWPGLLAAIGCGLLEAVIIIAAIR